MQSLLQRHIMAELGFDQPLDPDRPLNEVGLDLLGAVKLSITLEREFGIPMSIPELIRGPTIDELAHHLTGRLPPPRRGQPGPDHEGRRLRPSATHLHMSSRSPSPSQGQRRSMKSHIGPERISL